VPPAQPRDPNLDPNVDIGPGAQIVSYTDQNATTPPPPPPDPDDTITIFFADDVGTFDAADPIEIRGNNGNAPLGAVGFNSPSLLGVGSTAPYLHHGKAADLPELFVQHNLGVGQSIADVLDDQAEQDLIVFLNTIDNRTETFRSETDDFLTAVGR
jgi:hypothetical protein